MPGPVAYVGYRPPKGISLIASPSIVMDLPVEDDTITVSSSTTTPGTIISPAIVMSVPIDAGNTSVGSSTPLTGYVVPCRGYSGTGSVPGVTCQPTTDPLQIIDPINGRDPKTCKDSTAGLQNYINSVPSQMPDGSPVNIYLPFDLRCESQIVLLGKRILTVGDPVNGKKKLIRTMSYPWRVRGDQRANSNNKGGICAPWLFDQLGGEGAITGDFSNPCPGFVHNGTDSRRNPYERCDVDGSRRQGADKGGFDGFTGYFDSGYDGLHFKTRTSAPFAPGSLTNKVIQILQCAGLSNATHTGTITTVAGQTRVVASGFFFYGGLAGMQVRGAPGGMFQSATRVASVESTNTADPDSSGFPCRVAFLDKPAAASMTASVTFGYASSDMTGVNKVIKSVPDGKTVTFYDWQGVEVTDFSVATNAWAITFSGASWEVYFLPNPAWNPLYDNGGQKPWTGYFNCLRTAAARNGNDPGESQVLLGDSAGITGIEIQGPNDQAAQAIINLASSAPMTAEFGHCLRTSFATNRAVLCYLHHPWGDGESGPGQLIQTTIKHTGRQGCTAHFDNKVIDRCVFDDHRHSAIDIEATGPVNNVRITNNVFGLKGLAWSSGVNGMTYTGNRSTQADIDAGLIDTLATAENTNWKCGRAVGGAAFKGSSNVNVSNNNFDLPILHGSTAWMVPNCLGLTFKNNHRKIDPAHGTDCALDPAKQDPAGYGSTPATGSWATSASGNTGTGVVCQVKGGGV